MKRIGIIMSHLGIGGNERSVSNISFALSDKYKIFIIPFDSSIIAFDYAGEICDVNVPAASNNFLRVLNSVKRVIKVKKIIKEKKLDTIYCFTSHTNIISHFPFKNVKKIVSCRDTGNLFKHHDKFRHMLSNSDLMIFNSHYMENFYLKHHPNDKDKIVVINNAIDLFRINNLKKESVELQFLKFTEEHFTIAAVGRFCKEKGFNNLLRSFELLRKRGVNAGLVIIGSGELEAKLKGMAKTSDFFKDILFLGYKSNPYKYLVHCDVFVLSSITEGFPNVIIEAMACDLPIVSTDCKSGPNEILNERCNYNLNLKQFYKADYGILTPEINESISYEYANYFESETELSNGIFQLYIDTELREMYKKKALGRLRQFDLETIRDKMLDVL